MADGQRAHRTADDRSAWSDAHGQAAHDVRFDWGPDGLDAIAAGAATVVIVDVLRFTTAVSVAVARGAEVLPYTWGVGDAAAAYARRHDAELAGRREDGDWSLSPTDLLCLPTGSRLVLPSPNGSALSFRHPLSVLRAIGTVRKAAAGSKPNVVLASGCSIMASQVRVRKRPRTAVTGAGLGGRWRV